MFPLFNFTSLTILGSRCREEVSNVGGTLPFFCRYFLNYVFSEKQGVLLPILSPQSAFSANGAFLKRQYLFYGLPAREGGAVK